MKTSFSSSHGFSEVWRGGEPRSNSSPAPKPSPCAVMHHGQMALMTKSCNATNHTAAMSTSRAHGSTTVHARRWRGAGIAGASEMLPASSTT